MNTEYNSISPVDPKDLCKPTNNIFLSARIIGTRARQILVQDRKRFEEDLESLDPENGLMSREELAIEYEKLPKPSLAAIREFLADELVFSTLP